MVRILQLCALKYVYTHIITMLHVRTHLELHLNVGGVNVVLRPGLVQVVNVVRKLLYGHLSVATHYALGHCLVDEEVLILHTYVCTCMYMCIIRTYMCMVCKGWFTI